MFAHFKQDSADWWRRFWNQPNKAYRNFQLVFFLLAAHFIIPSISYALNWQSAIWLLDHLGRILGASRPYRLAEASYVWRVLAVANVFSLGFMCLILMANVRRFYPVLLPLCVLKGCAALGFLVVYIWRYRFPAFLAVSIWDTANVLMFLYFAHTARWSLEEWSEEVLVPRLRLKQQ
jgi:hypothetical protein